MPFQYTFRADDIPTWDVDTRDLLENRDRELELYSTTIDTSFLNLNASNLTSGTVPSARMTGAYTGITGLGTLTSLTIDGPLSPSVFFGDWNQDNNWSGIRGSFGYLLTGSNGAGNAGIYLRTESTANPVYIGSNNTNTLRVDNTSATVTGTMNATTFSGSGASLTSLPAGQLTGLVASARLSGSYTGITGLGTISGQLTASTFVTNNSSPSLELGDWSVSATWSAVEGYNGYLLMGNTSDRAVYLRSNTTAPVRLGANQSNALIVNTNSSYTSVECDGGYKTSGTFGGYQFASRNTGDVYTWYSNNGDAFLYSSYFGDNVIGVARTTGITYLYRGVTGNVQNGSYGSMSMYGENGGYVGINFPGQTTTWMSATNGQIFGIYRNNTTWNFYVSNGTFVPSDERYKRDIEPLQYGMNLIREIVPVTFDPLTEDPSDDPEQTVGRTHYGFTTQNILQALTNAGETRDVAVVDVGGPDTTTGGDRQYLNHSALIAPMVKAIQELDARLQQLETT